MRPGRGTLVLGVGGLLVALSVGAVAWADNYKFRFTPADQALARSVALRRTDLATTAVWRGGPKKADLSESLTCPDYDPKRADLVVTGAADSEFRSSAADILSHVEVFQRSAMLRLDWQRSLTPMFVSCLHSENSPSSVRRIPFPHVATYAAAFRVLFDVEVTGFKQRVMSDIVLLGRGRAEIALATTANYANRLVVEADEVRLARILVARAPR